MHCYQLGEESGASDLPVGALKRIADEIMGAVSGPVTINITGGEPLMYQYHGMDRGVFELMTYLSRFDKLGELNIITTMRDMDQKIIHDFKMLPKLAYVKVSLESHDPLIDDHIRGLGHYRMTLNSIRELVDADLHVIIMTTLSKHNYRSVGGLCELAGELGTRGVIFERFVPLGRGAEEMRDSVITSVEWQETLSAIAGVAGTTVDELRPYKAFWVEGASVSGAPCCLGPTSMALMPDGTVYPCRRVPTPIGKLPEDGMERILSALGEYSSARQKCFDFDF
jgi:MoaA/NifB/PqqE/SkfB family radical SAM enzyme